MSIPEQKVIADELLDCLSIICPNVILAGGAPRDWYMNKEANDLDIYFSLYEGTASSHSYQLERVLPKGVKKVKTEFEGNTNPLYKHMKHLKRIYYMEYKGLDVQLILLNEAKDVWRAVDNIDCSICKIWYKNSVIHTTTPFLKTMKTKFMFLNEDYNWSDYHPKKMVDRFKPLGYYASTEKQCDDRLIKMAIEEL